MIDMEYCNAVVADHELLTIDIALSCWSDS